jgi:putative hydrolase of the HAD superfamily
MLKQYKHLFFDLDHTLWDFESNSGITLARLYQQYQLLEKGITDFEAFRLTYEAHNERFWEKLRKGEITREVLRWKRMWCTLLDFKIADEALAQAMGDSYLDWLPLQGKLMPHTTEVLDYCVAKGYNMHIITNGFENTQWQKLKTSGIAHYFKAVITSEASNSMKPKPDIFEFALNAAGAQLQDSIMIGDALDADVLGAQAIGMDQIYYNPNRNKHQEKPTHEIDNLMQLMHLL